MAISKIKLPDNSTEELHDNRIHGVKIFYGTCSTAGATGEKAITCPAFTSDDLGNGTILFVSFTYNNTAEPEDIKLNVNSTGAYQVRKVYNYASSNLSNAGEIREIVHQFICWKADEDDYRWYLIGADYNTNTTYSAMSQANIDAGTSTSGLRISPKLLRDNFYTEDEVDALISAATEMPTLYVGSSSSMLSSDDKAHNIEVLNSIAGFALAKRVLLIDRSDSDTEFYIIINSVVPIDSSTISFDAIRLVGVGGTHLYQELTGNVVSGDITWSGLTTHAFLLDDSISTNIITDATSDSKVASPKAVKTYVDASIPSVPVTDVTVGGTSVVSNGVAAITLPTVPTISTNVQVDRLSNTKTSSPKSVYDEVHPQVESSQPADGMLPNVIYELGTLTGAVTFTLNTTDVDSNVLNHYYWIFDTSSTAPTITWPQNIVTFNGQNAAPQIDANCRYEISVIDDVLIYSESIYE